MKKELYLLTGFLGSGKTSLLLHLLNRVQDRKIGIIQNEFGKLSIDGEILRRGGFTMVEINRGSIFCSCLKLNFVQALAELGQMELDTVFVDDTTLVALPGLVLMLTCVAGPLNGSMRYGMGVVATLPLLLAAATLLAQDAAEKSLPHRSAAKN